MRLSAAVPCVERLRHESFGLNVQDLDLAR